MSRKDFRLLKKIKDPKFEIDRLEFYSLSLFLGIRDFQLLITDVESNRCLLLEDYVFDSDVGEQEKFESIRFIFDDHHLLLAKFWHSINFIVKNRSFSLIPKDHFEEEKVSAYLQINSHMDIDKDEIMLCYHKDLELVNVFSVSRSIVDFASAIYPGKQVKYVHQSSLLINGVTGLSSNKKNIIIYIDRFGLHIAVGQDQKLLFYNQYTIRKFSDYLKFIRMSAGELQIDLKNDLVHVYGYLGEHTPQFKELIKYIPQLTLGQRPGNLQFSYVFDEIFDHQYFDLFSAESKKH